MPNNKTSPVSSATEQKIREAMRRLFAGSPKRCDGQLTKSNLAREAGVSEATLYRAKLVLREWDEQVTSTHPRNAQAVKLEEELKNERKRSRRLQQQNAELKKEVLAAATVIAELTAHLDQLHAGTVVALNSLREDQSSKP